MLLHNYYPENNYFLVNNEDINQASNWLKINQAPWEIVLEKWSLSSKYRLQVLTKLSDKILSNIFEEWPLLKHPYGYKLIEHDFNEIQLTHFALIYEKLNEFFNIIEENVQCTHKNDNFIDLRAKLNLDISESKVFHIITYIFPHSTEITIS